LLPFRGTLADVLLPVPPGERFRRVSGTSVGSRG
jgi:hypothetical protein